MIAWISAMNLVSYLMSDLYNVTVFVPFQAESPPRYFFHQDVQMPYSNELAILLFKLWMIKRERMFQLHVSRLWLRYFLNKMKTRLSVERCSQALTLFNSYLSNAMHICVCILHQFLENLVLKKRAVMTHLLQLQIKEIKDYKRKRKIWIIQAPPYQLTDLYLYLSL